MACLYQAFPVKDWEKEGKGDCWDCGEDEKNKDCSCYIGVSFLIVDIKQPIGEEV